MKNLGILLLAFASTGVLANEVGAPFSQLNSAAELAASIAETGTSTNSWALEPNTAFTTPAEQHATLNSYAEVALEKLNLTMRERILSQLEENYLVVE